MVQVIQIHYLATQLAGDLSTYDLGRTATIQVRTKETIDSKISRLAVILLRVLAHRLRQTIPSEFHPLPYGTGTGTRHQQPRPRTLRHHNSQAGKTDHIKQSSHPHPRKHTQSRSRKFSYSSHITENKKLKEKLHKRRRATHGFLNTGGHEFRSRGSIALVVPVVSGDDDAVVADVVAIVTDDEDLGGGNGAEALVLIWVSECDDYTASQKKS
ncbi:hypothetical protein IAQ61_001214 [Plenodomus lingam]|uniref:uncharacterized protein n=1 Tax=Leptosphaeria maculans TaxID=5022 RepID=UPI00331E7E3C|nr:hypothetical protein IAQ61_001214 [Plenodomus lingam]